MKAIINYDNKTVCVGIESLANVGWAGFHFAKNHRDLVEAGWVLVYFSHDSTVFAHHSDVLDLLGVNDLAEKIREGPPCSHSCPQHPVVGIEGYQVVG